MNDDKTPIGRILTEIRGYSKTKIELLELYAIEKFTNIISSLTAELLVTLIVISFISLINIGAALWIGELLCKSYYGFFVVGSFYILISIVFYIFRDHLIGMPINNSII